MLILLVIFSIIGLIIIHELGHFLVAKKLGIKVEEFGIFLPPRLISKKIKETVYSFNLIPFGAFVKLYGEEERIKDERSFTGRPIWQRSLVVLAGVLSFWLVAMILLMIVFNLGVTQVVDDEEIGNLVNPRIQIIAVANNSPAQQVGLRPGDFILSLKIQDEEFKVDKVRQVQELTDQYKDQEISLTIQRGKQILVVHLIPRISPPIGEGPIGLGLVRVAQKSYSFFQALIKGITTTFNLTLNIISGLAYVLINLVRGLGLPAGVQLMGPVGIGSLAVQAAQVGLAYFLQFIATLAIYLAVFNLIPLPALDGGKLLFLLIEKIKGQPINQKLEQKVTAGFFILLIVLMIWITIKDIARLF